MGLFDRFRTPENGTEPEHGVIGLKKWWLFGSPDVFDGPAREHDEAYEGRRPELTQEDADQLFLAQCLVIAGDSTYLKARAYFFYSWILVAKLTGMSTWRGRR